MNISKIQVQNILNIYGKTLTKDNVNKSQEINQKLNKADKLALSDESKIKQSTMQAIKGTDYVRTDKINELKEQISSGTYKVSDGEVAEKMISQAIVDKLV